MFQNRVRDVDEVDLEETIITTCSVEDTMVYQPEMNVMQQPESYNAMTPHTSAGRKNYETVLEIVSDEENEASVTYPDDSIMSGSLCYQCPHCSKMVKSSAGLKSHISKIHNKPKSFFEILQDELGPDDFIAPDPPEASREQTPTSYNCPYCPKIQYFKKEKDLKCHITMKHKKNQQKVNYGYPEYEQVAQPIQYDEPWMNREYPAINSSKTIKKESLEITNSEATKGKSSASKRIQSLFRCDQCHKKFRKNKNLEIHVTKAHRQVSCPECLKKFYNKRLFMNHMRKHIKERMEKEEQAKIEKSKEVMTDFEIKQEPDKYEMNEMKIKSEPDEVSEEEIPKQRTKTTLRRHGNKRKKSVIEDLYECSICGIQRPSTAELKKHMLAHNSYRSHACKVCLKTFKYRRGFLEHWNNFHYNVTCQTCAVTFQDRRVYRSHFDTTNCPPEVPVTIPAPDSTIKLNSNAGNYQDNPDGIPENGSEEFIIPDDENNEALVVNAESGGVIRFEITEIEGTTTTTKDARIESEVEINDEDDDERYCHICRKKFLTQQSLKGHKWKYHKLRTCTVCGLKSYSYETYQVHIRTHTDRDHEAAQLVGPAVVKLESSQKKRRRTAVERLSCRDMLDEEFKDLWIKVGKSFQCKLCGVNKRSKFCMIQHRVVHTNERNFACTHPGCTKTFKYVSGLNEHMSNHGFEATCEECNNHKFCDRRLFKRHMQKKHQRFDIN